jgi:hypothetical protein
MPEGEVLRVLVAKGRAARLYDSRRRHNAEGMASSRTRDRFSPTALTKG